MPGNHSPSSHMCHPWQATLCFPMENISIAWPKFSVATRSLGQKKPLFFLEKQGFPSLRMIQGGE